MENKKTLILTIVGVLVLVLAVVGVSFAMYTFTGTGSRENVIRTGTVSIDYEAGNTEGTNTKIALTNQYPISDAKGSQLADGAAQLDFAVAAEMSGTMTINYELALTEVTEGATLKDEYIKFNVKKGNDYLLGTANTGVTVASRAAETGTMTVDEQGTKAIDSYLLDKGTFTQTGTVKYSIRAWVSEDYDLPQNMVNTDGTHTNNTTSETFSFKVKVVAAQQ